MNESWSGRALRGDVFSEYCPSRDVLKHVTSRWGMLLLVALREAHGDGDARRFAALRRKVGGISERMLAQTLVWLEQDGFVQRIVHSIVPPHVEYRLTPLGEELAARVGALLDWIEANLDGVLEARHGPAGELADASADAATDAAASEASGEAQSPLDGVSQGALQGERRVRAADRRA